MDSFRIRDPVHDFIELSPAERSAIDSRPMQRLRDIRQLAMTHLVYPGAVHTRFEHSLGVCHIAGAIAGRLGVSNDDKQMIRAAALLHDVGHGPYSHVSEAEMDKRSEATGVHEAVSAAIVRTDSQLRDAFGIELCHRAADLIEHTGEFTTRSTLRDIVSGPSDADKLDYLLRDSHFAGVNYGRFDLPRLLDSVIAIEEDEVQSYLGFKHGGLWAVEELLLARHHMHRQVYGHKTRVATDIMVRRALSLGIDEEVIRADAFRVPLSDGRPAPDEDFIRHFLEYSDRRVMSALLNAGADSEGKEMAVRLNNRSLIRRASRASLNESSLGGPALARILDSERMDPQIPGIEQEIASQLGCPAHCVALRIEEMGSPISRAPSAAIGPKDILLETESGKSELFHNMSEVFTNSEPDAVRFASLYVPKEVTMEDKEARGILWDSLKNI